jgi:hypothetical protein
MTRPPRPAAGTATGMGISVGAALGLLAGLTLSGEMWLTVGAGAVAGLLAGAIFDMRRSS